MATKEKMKVALKSPSRILSKSCGTPKKGIFFNIFMSETSKGMHKVLRYSKDEIHKLSCKEDDRTVHQLKEHESG